MRTTAFVFTVGSLLAAGAIPAEAALAASAVSIRMSPAVPVEGKPVDLFAYSDGGAYNTYAWDLDGDGRYGEATGGSTRQILPPGARTIGVRVTDQRGSSFTERRSISAATNFPPTIAIKSPIVMELDQRYMIVAESWEEDGQIAKFEFDLDGDGAYEATGTPRNTDRKRWTATAHVSFDTPGEHPIRVRATDDSGASAVATVTARVPESDPWAVIAVHDGDQFDHALVAGQSATVGVTATRPGVKHEFDLDGDGTYELDNGASNIVKTTFSPGPHTIGARITDTRGAVLEPRISTFVFEPSDAFIDKMWVRRLEASAVAGEPIDLTATVENYSRSAQVDWDADGDGDFDDGTATTPGGVLPNAGVAHNTFIYGTPGVYEQRVRLTVPGLPTRVFSARIFVGTRPLDRTPSYLAIGVPYAALAGQPTGIQALASSLYGDPDLTFDLDGDGEFDDQPSYLVGSYFWTFNQPVTIAVKATDPGSGASTVGALQVQPAGADATPAVTLNVDGAGRASYVVDDPAGATSWDASWDTDGDGAYDDGTGPTSAPITGAGARTVGLRIVDSANRTAVVRKTFGAGASSVPAKLKVRPAVTKAKLATLLKRGLRVKPGCEAVCSATVTVTVSKATAKRLKLRSRTLGRATGKGKTITVKLNARARKALRGVRSVKLDVAIGAMGSDGRAGTAHKALTIRR